MSEELLSVMLDGECTPAELAQLLAALERSPQLQARWSRMCLIRDALSGTRVRSAAPTFAASVMTAIDAETVEIVESRPNVLPLRRPAPAVVPSRARRWQRQPLIGLAAAASIAAVVVVGGRGLLQQPVGQTTLPVASTAGNPASVAVSIAEPVETRWTQLDDASARQLNGYLMEHSNSRAESGMGGALSYARLAVRTADYRPADEPR